MSKPKMSDVEREVLSAHLTTEHDKLPNDEVTRLVRVDLIEMGFLHYISRVEKHGGIRVTVSELRITDSGRAALTSSGVTKHVKEKTA